MEDVADEPCGAVYRTLRSSLDWVKVLVWGPEDEGAQWNSHFCSFSAAAAMRANSGHASHHKANSEEGARQANSKCPFSGAVHHVCT